MTIPGPLRPQRIAALLSDRDRPGAPEPSLLPWLAGRVDQAGLVTVARAAGSVSTLNPSSGGWPVVADAVAPVLAQRADRPEVLRQVLDELPPVAAYLTGQQGEQVNWATIRPESRAYAVLAGQLPEYQLGTVPSGRLWLEALGAIREHRCPPLSDLRSMITVLARGGTPETDEETVYLLPFRFRAIGAREQASQREQATDAILSAVDRDTPWYAAALLARASPYLNDATWARIRRYLDRLPVPWAGYLLSLTEGPVPTWLTAGGELAASHPLTVELNHLTGPVVPGEPRPGQAGLARVCADAADEVFARHGFTPWWEPDVRDLDRGGFELRPPALSTAEPDDSVLYGLPDEASETALALDDFPESTPAARSVNVYVAEAGHDEPVPDEPLTVGRDYDILCNIGLVDPRSLLDVGSAKFPEELLPDGPLTLEAVLFVDGRARATAELRLPVTGASDWVRLTLPRPAEPSLIEAELGIYYDGAPILVYSLTVPVGMGIGGTQARRVFGLTNTFTNLPDLNECRLSMIDSETGSAVYINGLGTGHEGFAYNPEQLSQAIRDVRTELYDAHFIPAGKTGEVRNRYRVTAAERYEKPMTDFVTDLRRLAHAGSSVYRSLFAGNRIVAPHRLRTEAEAYERPPVLRAISLGHERLAIPWAALYDLPLSNEPDEYVVCPSIAEFGPGARRAGIPVHCPYEKKEHRDERGRWRLNQLCPWGFWGLSAVIEYPPSARRDLEVVGTNVGPPTILVSYDTALDAGIGQRHLKALQARHGAALIQPEIKKRHQLQDALENPAMDIVYFYCHIKGDHTRPDRDAPVIGLGREQVAAQDISVWTEYSPHDRHPLVVINGCRSFQAASGSLYNLIDPFINDLQACGVIGSEVTLEQGLAGWVMRMFLGELDRWPVGRALHLVRWEMFRSGNVMGLAYSPYCLAGLSLVPQQEAT